MPTTTRSYGPLHFEDLDPKRFEDLVRQLAYEFRPWRKLEATGRAGSDDGFDARGFEIAAASGSSVPTGDTDDEDAAEVDSSDRLWLIQCKRERAIGPSKLEAHLDEIKVQPNEPLHGLVFVAACDFSKKSYDVFNTKCRALGVQECYLWGKAAVEDLLFQPKNDHLLFAYFGFSLAIRQRSLQASLRRDIATKKRIKAAVEKSSQSAVLLRNAAGDMYPKIPSINERFGENHWRICPFEKLTHEGLEVDFVSFLAYADGESWDAADVSPAARRSNLYMGNWGIEARRETDLYSAASGVWDTFPDENRAWLSVRGIIPYQRILAVDDLGDELFEGPHVYCRFEGGVPYEDWYAVIVPVRGFGGGMYVDEDDGHRIQKFPAQFRRKK